MDIDKNSSLEDFKIFLKCRFGLSANVIEEIVSDLGFDCESFLLLDSDEHRGEFLKIGVKEDILDRMYEYIQKKKEEKKNVVDDEKKD